MADPRLAEALARIEAAAARLEGTALPVPASAGAGDLAERHRRLRAATTVAIARLDRLIDSGT